MQEKIRLEKYTLRHNPSKSVLVPAELFKEADRYVDMATHLSDAGKLIDEYGKNPYLKTSRTIYSALDLACNKPGTPRALKTMDEIRLKVFLHNTSKVVKDCTLAAKIDNNIMELLMEMNAR